MLIVKFDEVTKAVKEPNVTSKRRANVRRAEAYLKAQSMHDKQIRLIENKAQVFQTNSDKVIRASNQRNERRNKRK